MSDAATIDYAFRHARSGRRRKVHLQVGDAVPSGTAATIAHTGSLPRVTRLLALAHKFQDMLRRGEVESMAELARAGRVTRARLSQIMNLTLLAPDIQDEILHVEPTTHGRDPVIVEELMKVLASPIWDEQRMRWRATLQRRRP